MTQTPESRLCSALFAFKRVILARVRLKVTRIGGQSYENAMI
jgi:hypothetical protein